MISVLFLGIIALLVYSIARYYQHVAKFPKGPLPLPFIGNLSEFDPRSQHKLFERLGKKYDGIYTIFTPAPFVQITDFQLIKEAFVDKSDDFAGRPTSKVLQEAFFFAPNVGVVSSNGDNWRAQRRTAITILRDFGMGKNLMEERIRSSVADYIDHLKGIENKAEVDMRWPIQVMVANIVNEALFGYRYTYEDSAPLMQYVDDFNNLIASLDNAKGLLLGMAIPILTKLPIIGWYTFGRFKSASDKVNEYIVENVAQALKDYNVEDEPNCFAQAYKLRMDKTEPFLDMANLLGSSSDFFAAGQETTTSTLRWAMRIFAKYPEIQEKLRQEVHSVVGRDRLPFMADQQKMPYARACVLELQRFANILSTNVQRTTVRDTEIRGHKIPAGTLVNGDIHYLMANDPLFEHPEEFRPERYLAEDGKTLIKDLVERTLPFSLGKRVCVGEGIARVELFLGVTATLQHFKLTPRPGDTIDLEPRPGQFLLPKPQNLRIQRI